MQSNTLTDLYFTALRKMLHGEKQLVDAMPDLVDNIADDKLKSTLRNHVEAVLDHRDGLEHILEHATENAVNLRNLGIEALIGEANAVVGAYDRGDVQDAGLTAVIQHIVHYKIACYGSLSTYAKMLGRDKELDTLLKTLKDENSVDDELTDIAKKIVNADARSS